MGLEFKKDSQFDTEQHEILRILRFQKKFNGRTEIQKKFLFFEKMGFPLLDLGHYYYLNGPFSSTMDYYIDEFVSKGFLIEICSPSSDF